MKTTEPFFTAEYLNNTFGITLEHANAKVLPLQEELQRALRENEELKKGYITVGQWDALIAENERLREDLTAYRETPLEEAHKLLSKKADQEILFIELNQKLTEQNRIMKDALTEALDWICPHTEAAEQFKKTGPRVWCNECSQYLRSEADATVSTRLSEALAKVSTLQAAASEAAGKEIK